MFLELHRAEDNKKVLFNVNNINTIYEDTTDVYIYIGEIAYRVEESYSEIIKVLKLFKFLVSIYIYNLRLKINSIILV